MSLADEPTIAPKPGDPNAPPPTRDGPDLQGDLEGLRQRCADQGIDLAGWLADAVSRDTGHDVRERKTTKKD